MPVLSLDHVQLAMPAGRESEARDFYTRMLGLAEVEKPASLAARGGCWFAAGSLKVHLGVAAAFVPARKPHPAFIVDDLRAMAAMLEKNRCRLAHDQPLEGCDRLFVDDPFGNRIELMQPTA